VVIADRDVEAGKKLEEELTEYATLNKQYSFPLTLSG
jgi:hypothetical protein